VKKPIFVGETDPMYVPEPYRPGDLEEVRDFIRAHPFAVLIGRMNGSHWGTHLPFVHERTQDGKDLLHSHMAKRNPQWKGMEDEELMLIFQGANAYVSSSWYEEENVPTWNYIAVHAYGRARILEGEELVKSMKKQMEHYEKDEENPLSLEDMDPDLFQREIKGLVGFRVEVERFHAAYKLSQDKNERDHANVIRQLEKKDDPNSRGTAREMKERRGKK
jgi:transcriptional regulator